MDAVADSVLSYQPLAISDVQETAAAGPATPAYAGELHERFQQAAVMLHAAPSWRLTAVIATEKMARVMVIFRASREWIRLRMSRRWLITNQVRWKVKIWRITLLT